MCRYRYRADRAELHSKKSHRSVLSYGFMSAHQRDRWLVVYYCGSTNEYVSKWKLDICGPRWIMFYWGSTKIYRQCHRDCRCGRRHKLRPETEYKACGTEYGARHITKVNRLWQLAGMDTISKDRHHLSRNLPAILCMLQIGLGRKCICDWRGLYLGRYLQRSGEQESDRCRRWHTGMSAGRLSADFCLV